MCGVAGHVGGKIPCPVRGRAAKLAAEWDCPAVYWAKGGTQDRSRQDQDCGQLGHDQSGRDPTRKGEDP